MKQIIVGIVVLLVVLFLAVGFTPGGEKGLTSEPSTRPAPSSGSFNLN